MKILIYSELFFPSVGGIERITFDLASGLATCSAEDPLIERMDVTVVTRAPAASKKDNRALPFRVVRRPTFRELWNLISEADLLHLAGPAMLPLAMGLALRKPVITEHHGFQTVCPNGQLFHVPERRLCPGHYRAGRYAKCYQCNLFNAGRIGSLKMLFSTPLRRWLSQRSTVNIAPTAWLAEILKLSRTETVYHGLSLCPVSNTIESRSATFAFQGRLVSTKGVGVILDAAKKLRASGETFLIKIVGDGPERRVLERQAETLDGYVQFLGRIPDDQLVDALSDVGAVLVPSLAGEVFGLVAAENMLRGKLVIVSNIGALEEVVDGTGIITVAGDASELASAMLRVIRNPSLCAQLGYSARQRAAKHFDLRGMIRSHIAVYRKAGRYAARGPEHALERD